MADAVRVCLASQTPPVRFLLDSHELAERGLHDGEVPDLAQFREGADYVTSAGGVPVMLRAVLPRLLQAGRWRDPTWIALNTSGPERFTCDGVEVTSVTMEPAVARQYGMGKEKMWSAVHQLGQERITPPEARAYAFYNWRTARAILDTLPDADVAYVHDFQLLQVGALLGVSAPAVFRWHIPLRPRVLNPYLRNFITRCLESYDAVVVSTRRDLEGLVEAGYRGRAHQMYPYVEPPERRASTQDVQAFSDKWGLKDDTPLLLLVARMDPIKGQDRVLRALPTVLRKVPEARLLLVGDGSFTSAKGSGLGHPKGRKWKEHLDALTASEGLQEAVGFTGYMPPQELEAAWSRADVVCVPSTVEGFGTTAIEGWMRQRPVVISRGAGASELVLDGLNGFTYDPDDVPALAGHLIELLARRDLADRMGRRGAELARICDIERGADAEDAVVRETIQRFHEDHAR